MITEHAQIQKISSGGVGVLTTSFCHQRISQRARTDLPREVTGPKGTVVSRGMPLGPISS